ncbi:hypothetical protein M0R45_019902 [Rubus argutus]|uniref:HSF-type DNA-binding domain-containing protein n=1 Tax=Rubus argutus TaxID=59490 RepID=A0AAW1X7Q2_RUBAR
MNPQGQVTEAPLPVPMKRLKDRGPPPFLNKTYEMVDDSRTNHIVSWSRENNTFVVSDLQDFSMGLLPKYFKHNNFSSFVRQLNTYGFKKVDTDKWEFAHEGFLRGQKHLLKNIRRKRTFHNIPHASQPASDSCIEVRRFGSLDGEIDELRRDKEVLTGELVKLTEQLQTTSAHLHRMEDKLKRSQMKQQQMMNFLARAMQTPNFVQELVQMKDMKKQVEESITKKRRRSIAGPSSVAGGKLGQGESFVNVEPQHYGDISELDVSEFDIFVMDMLETDENRNVHGGKECMDKEEEHEILDDQEKDEEDINVLIDQIGCLISRPK